MVIFFEERKSEDIKIGYMIFVSVKCYTAEHKTTKISRHNFLIDLNMLYCNLSSKNVP